MKVIWSERASNDLMAVLDYLIAEWGVTVAEAFYAETLKVVEHIRIKPNMFPAVNKQKPEIRCALVSKHNKLFYTVDTNTIFIITLFDTRQHSDKLKL